MKSTLFAVLLLLAVCSAGAETLEEVSFGPGTSTHLTDINNAGFICGWYDSAGYTRGFVINPDGVIIRSAPAGTDKVKFMGINDHNVIVINYTVGSTITVYKAYYNALSLSYTPYVAVNGNQQPGLAQPYGINNNNDMSGWYQGAAFRFLWALHDSLSTTPQWAYDKYTVYNTMGTGINDNGITTGFAINGSNYYPYLYDVPTNTFTVLNTSFHMKPWGINNNNVICGEYWQTSGFYTAFWGAVVNGIVQTHALSSLWHNTTTQSVANGINDKNEIVGEYVHPNTGNYVGFIVRTAVNEYRLPDYNWNRHTYSMVNSTSSIASFQPVWSSNYYGSFSYNTTDPYANNGRPLVTPLIVGIFPWAATASNSPSNICVDWLSMATELDTFGIGRNPAKLNQYLTVWKPWAFTKWVNYTPAPITFPGICYGFAFTSLIRYADSNLYQNWYGIPATTNLYSLQNNNTAAVSSIARTFFKQNDKSIMIPPFGTRSDTMKKVLPWSGLYRLKNCYLNPIAAQRNPRAIFISEPKASGSGIGFHSVLPYKIRTPQKFPFNNGGIRQYDTLFVYDSNYPNDSTVKSLYYINSDQLYSPIDSARSTGHTLIQIAFNEAGIKEMQQIQFGQYKATAAPRDQPFVNLAIGTNPQYVMGGTGGTTAGYTGSIPFNNIPYLGELTQKDTGFRRPSSYTLDTLKTVTLMSTAYPDSIMSWNISNNRKSMGINRRLALNAEKDYSTVANRVMTYGTHDAAAKSLNAYFIEMNDDITQGVNIMASNITVANGDSLITSNPSSFVYKITRITGATDNYDLWIYVAGTDDSVRQFRINNLPIGPNTSHTIDPYSGGTTGTQVSIKVDAGNNGTVDSTITINPSLGLYVATLPADFIKIYPNPADKQITVDFAGNLQAGCSLMISDAAGRMVSSQVLNRNDRKVLVSLVNTIPGTYFIRVLSNEGSVLFTDRFVRQ